MLLVEHTQLEIVVMTQAIASFGIEKLIKNGISALVGNDPRTEHRVLLG